MTTPGQDLFYQYSDGRDLLAVTLVEREQLLRELENLVKEAQGIGSGWLVARFDVTRAQTLLYKLDIVNETIDSLIEIINDYADRGGFMRVENTIDDRSQIENRAR